MVLDHHIFNTSEEIQPQLLKATPLYIIMDIVSLTVNHTLSNHMVFTLREKNEWLYSLKCKALYLTFQCEKPHWARSWGCWALSPIHWAPLASSEANRSWRHSTTCWINPLITKSSLQSDINMDSHFTDLVRHQGYFKTKAVGENVGSMIWLWTQVTKIFPDAASSLGFLRKLNLQRQILWQQK